MNHRTLALLLGLVPLALGAVPPPALAQSGAGPATPGAEATTVDADYAFYTAGLNTGDLSAAIDLSPSGYRVKFNFHTAGVFGAFIHGQNETVVEGRWQGSDAVPERYDSVGLWSGQKWETAIDYADLEPFTRVLTPPREPDRDPVTPAQARQTLDSLSAMALMVRRVQLTGSCDGTARLFDGRRLMELTAHTVGNEDVPRSSRSPYWGTAQRCDFEGLLIGGFEHDKEESSTRRPKRGSAWFAAIAPGAPPMPIRMDFETLWFGTASMYLTAFHPQKSALVAGAPR
jgi:hypothetical protein